MYKPFKVTDENHKALKILDAFNGGEGIIALANRILKQELKARLKSMGHEYPKNENKKALN